jgi:hypothetical protein
MLGFMIDRPAQDRRDDEAIVRIAMDWAYQGDVERVSAWA